MNEKVTTKLNEKEKDREELDFLVDKLQRDNWNAYFEKSNDSFRGDGEDLKIVPDE